MISDFWLGVMAALCVQGVALFVIVMYAAVLTARQRRRGDG